MKLSFFKIFPVAVTMVILSSCLGSSETTYSDNVGFYSLKFASDDSVTGIENTKFKVMLDSKKGDSIIYNLDSIAYKSDVNDVVATFTFYSSKASYYIYEDTHDTITLSSGTDTIDFTRPASILNISSDGTVRYRYRMDVRVHKANPALYVWEKLSTNIDFHNSTHQKLVAADNYIYLFINNGSNAYMAKSLDGKSWSEQETSNLPVNASLNDITYFNNNFYMTSGGNIYYSSDAVNWTVISDPNYSFTSIMFGFNNMLWAVAKSGSTYHIANSSTGTSNWIIRGEIPENFPVSEFTASTFTTKVLTNKMTLLGGVDKDGNSLATTSWSSEDGYNWYCLSKENKSLDTICAGASLIRYDQKLFVFGIRNDSNKVFHRRSIDEGLSWLRNDTLNRPFQLIPKYTNSKLSYDTIHFTPGAYPTAAVLMPFRWDSVNADGYLNSIRQTNRIFVITGRKRSTVADNGKYGDFTYEVWRIKKNKLNFLRQTAN